MISRLMSFLKEPYPFYYKQKNLPKLFVGIFVLGTAFLYFFQPFNINWEEHKYPFILICIIHSLAALAILLPCALLIDTLIKDKSNWQVYKEIVLIVGCAVLVGIANFLIRDFIYHNENDNWRLGYLLEEITNAFLITIIFYPIFLLVNNHRLKSRNEKEGLQMTQSISQQSAQPNKLKLNFVNANGNSELSLFDHQLYFIKSESNYISIHYKNEQQQIEKRLIRSTLNTVAEQYPHLFRAHRSYLVNLDQISRIGGNSQGYTLHFEDLAVSIPVSRNRKDALIANRKK